MAADTVTPPPAPQPNTPQSAPRRSFRKRVLRVLLPLLALVLLIVWFAPAIVAKTQLRNRFARQALADVRGTVDVGSASLSWLSPVELRDVVIKDEAGRTLVHVGKITSTKTLLTLARNQAEPGEFTIEKPAITVVCDKHTTNFETAFAKYLEDTTPPKPTRTPVTLKVTGGTLTITHAATNTSTTIEDISASATIPAKREEPIAVIATAATGKLKAEVSLGESNTAKISCEGFRLETIAPLLEHAEPGFKLTGTVGGALQAQWGKRDKQLHATVVGTANANKFSLSAPWLNGEPLALDFVQLPLNVELAGRSVRVREFDLRCDVGTLSVAGTFDPDEDAEKLLTRAGLNIHANVELAKLGNKLKTVLKLKEGTEFQEGKLEVKLASKATDTDTIWEGKINTTAIKAKRGATQLVWDEPLQLDFAGKYKKGALPTFEKLVCTSDFIAVNARLTNDTLQAAANVYLHKLGTHLSEFIELGGYTLSGEATATLIARRDPQNSFIANGMVELKDFAFLDQNKKGLNEPALTLQLTATGKLPDTGAVQLTTAKVVLSAKGDELHLALREPVTDLRKLTSGAVEVNVTGELSRWKNRASAFAAIPNYEMSGTLLAQGIAKFGDEKITIDRLTLAVTRIRFHGAGVTIDEPTMNAVGDLTFTRKDQRATITKLQLNSAPLTVTSGTLTLESLANKEVAVSGDGQCTADLNRLGKTVRLYTNPNGPTAFHGRGVGPLRFRAQGDTTTFGGTLDVTNFGYGLKDNYTWFEPNLKLEVDGAYTGKTDAVTFSTAKAERPGLALSANGSLASITTTQAVDFKGTVRYDWARLTPLARDLVGGNFTATGNGERAFTLNGQLNPANAQVASAPPTPEPKTGGPITLKAPTPGGAPSPKAVTPSEPSLFVALNGDAAIGWQTIKAYGFDLESGELKGTMKRGVITVAPLSANFGGGRISLTPTLKMDRTPGEVSLAKGTIIDRAKLTPQATASALGYALPAIANAGQAEGEISANIDDNRIVFGKMDQSTLKGNLVIHKATVGLNPLASQLATLLGAKATSMTLVNDSTVPVQVANGRVYHQNFAMRISGTTFVTNGSVGFDDTLDLVVDVPLPKDLPLLKNNPLLLKAVAGKVVKVPVKGTLTKPTLEPKAFENAVVTLAREGARDVGKDVLEGELKKLFPNMPAPNPKTGGGLLPFPLPFPKKP
jgi:hypothetical protein